MRKKKQPKEFEFPQLLLKQISECSKNGFALFFFNADGHPQIVIQYDTIDSGLALQTHVCNWAKAMENINIQYMAQNILQEEEPPTGKK